MKHTNMAISHLFKLSILFIFLLANKLSIAQTPALSWGTSLEGYGTQHYSEVLTDSLGNVYALGIFYDTADFDPGSGVLNLTTPGSANAFIQKLDPSGNLIWAKQLEGTGSSYLKGAILDSNGNIFVVGNYTGTVDFDPGSGTMILSDAGGYVLKLDNSGNYTWVKVFQAPVGLSASVSVASISVDNQGDIYATGAFSSTVDFDPSYASTYNLTSNGSSDVFTVKLNQNGNFRWARAMGASSYDLGVDIVVDDFGNVYSTGSYRNSINMNPTGTSYWVSNSGGNDTYIQKLDTAGNFIWGRTIGGSSTEEPAAIAVDPTGNVITTGYFTSYTLDIDPGTPVVNLTCTSGYNAYIQKLNPTGDFLWGYEFGDGGSCTPSKIKTDNTGAIYTIGTFDDDVDFDPFYTATILYCTSYEDTYIQKLNSDGSFAWAAHVQGTLPYTYTLGKSICIDNYNNVYAAGYHNGTVDVDPSSNVNSLTTMHSYDGYLLKLHECTGAVTSTDTVNTCGSYTWIDGNTYTSSNYSATHTLTSTTGCDSIVTLNLTIGSASTSTATVTACDSYTWTNGVTYTSSNNTAIDTLSNIYGCDSIVTLDLTILNSSMATDVITTCDSYTWIDGNTYTSSNTTATHTLTNAAGCDSIVTLDLTILNTTTNTDVITSCNSYTWIDGNTYTSSNNSATYTLTNSVGCDSVVTLDLTINTPTYYTDVITSCGSYTWINGNTYNANNTTATHILTNSAGCDSIVTLDLTILSPTSSTDVISACDNYTWIDGNTYTSSNTTATHTLTNAVGCDSVVTLNLTISNSTSSTDVITSCGSYTWINGNTYTSSNNTATYTLTNAVGCDSVIYLDLTVGQPTTATDVVSACGSYTWIDGNTYTSNNTTATYTLTNALGCDSTVMLDLTILQATSSTDVVAACGSYTWIDGNTYTSSNSSATYTLTNAAGCDSVVTLDLTILNTSASTDIVSACESYTWIDGNTYTSSNNTATYTLTNAVGCDSVVTLDLTILNATTYTDVISSCGSYTWIDGNTYTSSNNTATYTLSNAAGCDSIVTLDLTITQPTSSTDVVSACGSYTWIDGNTYTSNNNTATYALTNAAGCDSVITLDLTLESITVTTVAVGTNGLKALASNVVDNYQWVYCNNGLFLMQGETNETFTAESSGEYAVIVEGTNGCVDTSDCVAIIGTGIEKGNIDAVALAIYPNPTQGIFTLEFGQEQQNVSLIITNIGGQIVEQQTLASGQLFTLELKGSAGVYFCTVSTEDGIHEVIRLIKQ